jgi:hypothetical protein
MKSLIVAMENPSLNQILKKYKLTNSKNLYNSGISFQNEETSKLQPNQKLVYPLIKVKKYSPAHEAGMKSFQRVVAVNDKYVNKEFHTLENIIEYLDESFYKREFTEIKVLDPEIWRNIMVNNNLVNFVIAEELLHNKKHQNETIIGKYQNRKFYIS